MIYSRWEDVWRLYVDMSFYMGMWASGFWYPRGVLEPTPKDTEGWLYISNMITKKATPYNTLQNT